MKQNYIQLKRLIQLAISIGLYYGIYQIAKTPFAIFNYYFLGNINYLTKVPTIYLEDLLFTLSILKYVISISQFIFILAILFPIMKWLQKKFRKSNNKMKPLRATNQEMENYFLKSPSYFNSMQQQKRYTVPKKEELPTGKMQLLEKRK